MAWALRGSAWTPLVAIADKKQYRFVAYDLLGFGNSPKPGFMSYSASDHTRSLLASLDKDLKGRKLMIIGHSMGCLVASHIAWLKPGMVERLVLYEPPLFADSPEFRSHKRRRRLYFALYSELLKRPRVMFAYGKLMGRLAERRDPGLNPGTWTPFELSLKNTIMNQKAFDELKNVKVPTDIIYGRFDFVVTRADVKDMLKANQNVSFHLVKEMHDVTPRAAKYIYSILRAPAKKSISYTRGNAKP